MFHLHGDVIKVPWLCLLRGGIYVCVQHIPVCWQLLVIYVCFCMMKLIHRSIPPWFCKALTALDYPKCKAPKIEPWSHAFHRSGPPSSTTYCINYMDPTDYSVTQNTCLPFLWLGAQNPLCTTHGHGAALWSLGSSEGLLWQDCPCAEKLWADCMVSVSGFYCQLLAASASVTSNHSGTLFL